MLGRNDHAVAKAVTMRTAEVQGALWGAAAEDWAALVEPLSAPLFRRL